LLPAVLVLVFATVAFAQRDLGTITGTVSDQQGAVVPNVKITITEVATGLTYNVVTASDGAYTRPALKPGTYSIAAEAQGFRRVEQQNVVVTAGDRVGVNLTLPVGEISQSVEVTSQAPLLQTENTTLGADLNSKAMADLPLGGQRTFSFLARLSPGVLTAENGARDALGGGFSANGVASNGSNNFLLNGVDNNVNVIDFLNQTSFVIGPSVEAIGEMRVLTNGYNAEYGRAAGGVVNVTLKSGTNDLHGTIFEIMQNKDFDANRWEYNSSNTPRGQFEQNQFGAAVGGPIIKNRTFIFGDYQGTRIVAAGGLIQNLGNSGYYTIPTAAMVGGNFSALPKTIYDPNTTVISPDGTTATRSPFPGNIIPTSRMDPVAAKIAALYPATNQPLNYSSGYPQNDYFVSTPGSWVTDQGDLRIDHRLSDKDSLFGTLSWSNTNKTNIAPFPGALDGATFAGVPEQDLSRNAMVSWTRVWTPNLISETRLAFTRLVTSRIQTANSNTDEFKAFGIGGYNPMTALNGGLPQITFGTQFQTQYPGQTYSQIGANDWLPSKEYSNVWDFIQNVAVTKGSHAFKFGGEIRQIRFPFFQVPYPHGEMYFTQNETASGSTLNPSNTGSGDQMASFLLGNIDWGEVSTNNFVSSQKWAFAGYAQDDWKVTPKLTLNLGLRYELFSPINEGFGRQSNFNFDTLTLDIPKGPDQNAALPPNFATAFPEVTVSRGQVSSYLIPWDKLDLGPRFGLAYNWKEKTVIRAGYGIFYNGEEQQGGNPNRGESAPFNESPVLDRLAGQSVWSTNPYFTSGIVGGYPANVFSLPAPISFRDLAQDFRNTLVHKWNFAIQRELPGQMALEVAYVGNHTAHALLQPNQNTCPNSPLANVSCVSLEPYPNLGGLFGTASYGYGNYAGLTTTLTKRLSAGLQFLASYTYGHALSNVATTLSGSPGFGYIDPTNLSTSYSSASWDIRHNFVMSFNYDVPFGKGKKYGSSLNKVADTLVGNWSMNGILTIRTGQPITIDGADCVGVWSLCRPELIQGMNPQDAPSGGRTPSDWFNWQALTVAPAGTGGNLGLQSNTSPGVGNLDFSVFKDFVFTERWKLQFRAESFNLFNSPQFGNPDNNLSDADISVVGGVPQVVGQGNLGKITSTQPGSERHIQFSLRLRF
jgi:hypothetical protein